MNYFALPPLAAALANIFLILLVLFASINNRKRNIVVSYVLWNLSMAVWNLGFFALYNAKDAADAYRFVDFLMIGTLFIYPTTFNFILEFAGQKTKINKLLLYISYLFCFFFLFLHFNAKILSVNLLEYPWGFYPQASIGDVIYSFFFFGYSTYSQVLIYKLMKSSSGQKRNQYRYIFWGTVIGYAGATTNFLPPFGINFYPLGNITTILYTIAVAYALITVKMVNWNYLFRKFALELSTLLTILILCAAAFYPAARSCFLKFQTTVLFISIIVTTLIATHLLYRRLQNLYFSFLFRHNQIFKRDVQLLIKQIGAILTKNQLIEELVNMMIKMFMIDKGVLRLHEKGNILTASGDYMQLGKVRIEAVPAAGPDNADIFIDYCMEYSAILIKDDIEKKIEIGKSAGAAELAIFEEMKNKGFSALIPFKLSENHLGYFLLGNTLSGNMFDKDELDALALIKKSVDISLQNIERVDALKAQEKQIEDELQKANRLESLGILAGGIAHDFNNLLAIIMGNISIAKRSVSDNKNILEILKEAETSAKSAVGLSGQLSTFSKGGNPQKKIVSISEQLRDFVVFSSRGSKVKCEFSISEDLWLVDVDELQFNRVINNIVINATQAMPSGGLIEVSARNITLTPDNNIFKRKGDFVKISIWDHGVGISKENLSRIYDPYFTTKNTGSGLGLTIVYSIVKKHGGYIDAESEQGKGTAFHIYLPAADKHAGKEKKHETEKTYSGKGKVLVMDDNASIQLMLKRMLDSLGYDTVCCGNGIDAVEIVNSARESGRPFVLAVMDLTVQGGIGGKSAVSVIKQISPDIKTVVSSGYSDDDVMSHPDKYGFDGVIVKPYTIEGMSKLLNDILSKKK